MNDRLLGKFAVQAQCVYQQVVRARIKMGHCFTHRKTRSLINIDLIYTGSIDGRNSPGDSVLANAFCQNCASFRRQQFGISQTADAIRGIKDDSRSHDRSE